MSDEYDYHRWPMYGRLLNGVVVPCALCEWAAMFEDLDARRVGFDVIEGAHISTVFLGLNHGYNIRPLWFETMVSGLVTYDNKADIQWRYETLAEARVGHERTCAAVREHIEVLRAERRETLIADTQLKATSPPL